MVKDHLKPLKDRQSSVSRANSEDTDLNCVRPRPTRKIHSLDSVSCSLLTLDLAKRSIAEIALKSVVTNSNWQAHFV